jgi:hypothetical protein
MSGTFVRLANIFLNIPEDFGATVLYRTIQHFCSGLDLTAVNGQTCLPGVPLLRRKACREVSQISRLRTFP